MSEEYSDIQNNTNKSEVARLRAQIEVQCQALHHLTLFSKGASHEMIAHRYRALDRCSEELQKLVGPAEATKTLTTLYQKIV